MNIAIILSGGTGSRIGASIPKQFIKVQDKPILAYTLEVFQNNPLIDAIEIVCHEDWTNEVESICETSRITKKKWICTGGSTFQESTMNGIYNLKEKVENNDVVVLSFGVSPMTTQEEIDDCIRVCAEHGNAVSAAQMDLLLGEVTNDTSTEQSIDRDNIRGFANPWAFRYGELLQVYEEAEKKKILSTVEPHITSLYLALGKRLWFSKHNRQNIKITYKEDLDTFEGYLLLQKQKLKERINQEKEKYRMVSFKEFEILKCIKRFEECINMRNSCIIPQISGGGGTNTLNSLIEKICKFSNNEILFKDEQETIALLDSLVQKGYILDGRLTDIAIAELESCRVKNAVILAAGGADVSAKSVHSMPKGLFVKNGETLIERQIRQLKEAGIEDITVIIGYKQELYFFLKDKWNVKLEINPDLKKNNLYSLYIARECLDSTYILNCDNYFAENPFSAYEYRSYHATVYKNNAHNELVVRKNEHDRILAVISGEAFGECVFGHAYLVSEFSAQLKKYLEAEIGDFRVSSLFWEEYVSRHVDDLDMYTRQYSSDFIQEFDSIQEIQNIDGLFLSNVSGKINQKICEVLHCCEEEIKDINILEKGLTNILFTFVVHGKKYIFRYPGDSSAFFIYRKNECAAQKLAGQAHADDTCVYIDESGIKISKYRENCRDLHGIYYHDVDFMKRLAQKIRDFHELGYDLPDKDAYYYDPIVECERLFKEASKVKGDLFKIFEKEWIDIRKLQAYADKDGFRHTLCHNDINIDNVLLTDTTLDIIDWEFAGYNDPGYDFGRVIAGYEYEPDDSRIAEILETYFGRPANDKEYLHFMAYSAIHNWYYVGWALYKESINESSRDWMLFFYQQAKKLTAWCLPQYESIYGEIHDLKESEKNPPEEIDIIRQLNSELDQICQNTNTNRSGLDILINYYQKSLGWTEEASIKYAIELFKNGTIDQIKVFGKDGEVL